MMKPMNLIALFAGLLSLPVGMGARPNNCCNSKCEPTFIRERDLPYTINDPGVYQLCSDISWDPDTDGDVAITVNASDVVLDFRKYTLKQADDAMANCIGVLLNENLTNVQLLDGTLENISMWGIVALGGSSELLLDGINTLSCGYNGIDVFSPGNSGGLGIFNEDINGNATNPLTDVIMRNCNFNSNYSPLTTGYYAVIGCELLGVNQLLIQNSNFNNNSSSGDPAGVNTNGLFMQYCAGATLENCNFNENLGFGNAVVVPLYAVDCTELSVNSCNFLDTVCLGDSNNSQVAYFESITNLVFEDCLIQNFQATASEATYGLQCAICSNVLVKGCTVQNLYTLPGAQSYLSGYRFEACDQLLVEDCIAQDLVSSNYYFTTGFQVGPVDDGPASTNVIFNNCVAQNIYASNTQTGQGIFAAGFASIEHVFTAPSGGAINQNIIFQDCVAQNVVFNLNGVSTPLYAYGFEVNSTEGLEIVNCISQDSGVGYQLDRAQTGKTVSFSNISNNIAINNSVAGFLDNTITDTLGTNVFFGNTAYQNGQNYLGTGLGTDYGMAAGTPFRTWDFTGGDQPSPLTDAGNNPSALDNISIT